MNDKKYRRHHYIPQFILKNFYNRNVEGIEYYDLKTKCINITNTREIFMDIDLYRDIINSDSPIKIEKDFSKYESEVSMIIKKLLIGKEVTLTIKEYDSLMLFLGLLGLRSINVSDAYEKMKNESNLFSNYQKDMDYVDFWKRNLGYLVNCRSIEEVLNNEKIDEPIKVFVMRDVFGITGKYLILLERRGQEDFLIGDCYPCVMTGDIMNLHLYDFFPISSERIIILASRGVEASIPNVRIFDKSNLKEPTLHRDKVIIKVNKIYQNEVKYINQKTVSNCKIGVAFKDKKNISILPIKTI